MKKLIVLVLVLAATLLAGCDTELAKRAAWEDACRLSGTDCTYISRPKVGVSPRVGNAHAYGIYVPGTNVVWLRENILADLAAQQAYGVLVHEMVHYIDYRTGRLPMLANVGEACASEARAFDAYNTLMTEFGHPEWRRDGWKLSYPQCWSWSPKGVGIK